MCCHFHCEVPTPCASILHQIPDPRQHKAAFTGMHDLAHSKTYILSRATRDDPKPPLVQLSMASYLYLHSHIDLSISGVICMHAMKNCDLMTSSPFSCCTTIETVPRLC